MWAPYERRIWARLRAGGAGGLLFLCLCLFGGNEYFTGLEASDNYASGYVGAGYALGKAGLYERGWMLLLDSVPDGPTPSQLSTYSFIFCKAIL